MIAFLLILFASAGAIKAPAVVAGDSGAVIVSAKNGGRRWTANWTMEPIERNGKKAVRFTERGRGQISPFTGEVQWSLESVWSAEGDFQPLDSERTVTAVTGSPVLTEKKRLDAAKATMNIERQRASAAPERKSIAVPRDTLIPEGIAGVLRYLPFEDSGPFAMHLLSNEPRLYSVTFENRGTEHVKTAASEFDCYKVEMVPHLGVLNVVRYFYPKAFFWFTVAAPHFWVKYEGPENGPGTPEVVMELSNP